MTNNNGIVLSFGFIVFGVFCYFVGVVLRLPSVNIINNISIETNIRKIYYELKLKRVFDKTAIHVIWCGFRQLLHLSYKIIYLWPTPITTKRACRKLEKIQKKYKKRKESNALVDGLYKDLPDKFKKQTKKEPKECTKYEKKELLQDFIRQKGAKYLENIVNIKPEEYKKNFSDESDSKWILHSLWAVDKFPYPLWISTKAFQIIKSKVKQSNEETDFEK